MNKIHTPRVQPYRQHGRIPFNFEKSRPFYDRHPVATAIACGATALAGIVGLSKLTEVHADCSGPTVDYTVEPGDTLYSLAQNLKGEQAIPTDEIVNDIRDLNDIEGYTIYLGESIELPEVCRAD